MNNKDFDQLVINEHEASLQMLCMKAKEYATDTDRLANFKQVAALRETNTVDAAMGMVAKQMAAVAIMAKRPLDHEYPEWCERLRDIRNYTYLIMAVYTEMEETVCKEDVNK